MTAPKHYVVAKIDKSTCIGCAKCIDACPFDAILGAKQHLHTVIPDYCIGCKLCLPPCPVDCITLEPITLPATYRVDQAKQAKQRLQARALRLKAQLREKAAHDFQATQINFQESIAASIARAKQKRTAFSALNVENTHE